MLHHHQGESVYPNGQEWVANLMLASILIALLFLMTLSIYLVVAKPIPPTVPETDTRSGAGSAYADGSFVGPGGMILAGDDDHDLILDWS
jgi:hypothetical protein